MNWSRTWLALALILPGWALAQVQPHSVDELLARDKFEQIWLSPDGTHYALTVPYEDRTLLQVVRRADMATTIGVNPGSNNIITNVVWVNNERLVFAMAEKFGQLDEPTPTGEIYATDVDGGRQELLIGFRAEGERLGSRLGKGRQESGSAFILDVLPNDERKVLIEFWPWTQKSIPYSEVHELDVYTGKRNRIATSPVQAASFRTDHAGVVRFATGSGVDNRSQTWYRADADSDWQLINDQKQSKANVNPLDFSADGKTAWLRVEEAEGPDGIYAMDLDTLERKLVLRGDFADPHSLLYDPTGRQLVGARYLEGLPAMRYFDRKSPDAILYRILEKSFPGQLVRIDSGTRDGRVALLEVSSDRSPGDIYLFDTEQKKADLLVPRLSTIDPQRTAAMQPIALQARDGWPLHGYLTVPPGSDGKGLPMVVSIHGGPFGSADLWGYHSEVQLLAAQGYAVLQVNFRGSGNYGRAHEYAGYRQWGQLMQDDVTDATRWAIEQGHADPQRICIYGASYGAYSALMGAAREPALYHCAAGYVGVYDLPLMYKRGDIARNRSGQNYLDEVMGNSNLEAYSPSRLAERIKVPVFMAAGEKDERAPVDHTEAMEKALKKAGVPVQTLIMPTEGHGFYVQENRVEYYRQLLAFFAEHLQSQD
ncbi:MAG: S9 family peptidase [Xanthomonadales bacterium]|nr:S9 family peptidase [Xanthomonadales bacterium]